MNVLLFANGKLTRGKMIQRLLGALDSPRVICADGGALHAQALDLRPHTIIGDLDSLSRDQVAAFEADGVEIRQFSPDKDETDLELALRHCRAIAPERIHILGALGGRFDQTLANILLLTQAAFLDMRIEVVDGDQSIRLLRPGANRIDGAPGDTVSLLPLTATADGITTRNLRYPLKGESLHRGPARGISNVMEEERAEVAFGAGLLLLVHTIGRA